MQFHELKRKNKTRKAKQVGRGGKRGKTSGRGTKGQKSRTGRKLRPEMRDIIKRLPKNRGYRFNSFRLSPVIINLSDLEILDLPNNEVNPKALLKAGIFSENKIKGGVKILGTGDIKKKLKVSDCFLSKTAKEKIEKAGGTVHIA